MTFLGDTLRSPRIESRDRGSYSSFSLLSLGFFDISMKGMTEDEMAEWHRRLDAYEFG